ncbi:FtsX-like permease family protein, partial [Oceanithermus sp.]|uniref:FtsX-like permease family protein n=1 Tax=Oceanithermus sp. TaxID=2268145 RepID=UPI0025E72C0E
MRFAWFLALKHLRYRKTQSLITVLGVAAGVAVLTTALSLTNGFTQGLIDATLRAVPHVTLTALDPHDAPRPENPEIVAETPVLITKALLTRRADAGRGAGVDFGTLIGVGPGAAEVYPGLGLEALKPGEIVLGGALARSLGAWPGDRVYALSVNQKRRDFTVLDRFSTGNYLIDSVFAFTTLEDVQELLKTPGAIGGWHLRLADPERAPEVARELEAGGKYLAQTWQDANRTLIEQLALQKRVIGIVVFLIVVVAALGIANVLVLVVLEKKADIAILRVLGASAPQVAGAFALEAVLLGAAGVVLGDLLGWGLSTY